MLLADTLGGLQAQLPPGLVRLERQPSDRPEIVETWVAAPALAITWGCCCRTAPKSLLAVSGMRRFARVMPAVVNRLPVLTLWAAVVAEPLAIPECASHVSMAARNWISRKVRAVWCHAACRTRARRRLKPARPYMLRFNVLSRLIWPSAGLVVQGRSRAACTA